MTCDCGHRGYFYVVRILAGRVQLRCPRCMTVTECETRRTEDHRTIALPFGKKVEPIRVS